jgi:hypothetical protein
MLKSVQKKSYAITLILIQGEIEGFVMPFLIVCIAIPNTALLSLREISDIMSNHIYQAGSVSNLNKYSL